MKRFLLTFVLFVAVSQVFSQRIVINELYPSPGSSGSNVNIEYFELFNTTAEKVNLDCYTAVAIDVNTSPNTVWVFQLPAVEIQPFGHFLFSSATPIKFQGSQSNPSPYSGSNQFSWNSNSDQSAKLKKYTRGGTDGNTLSEVTSSGNLTDLIPISGGNGPSVSLMLFNGSVLENAFFGNSSSAIPSEITSLNPVTINMYSADNNPAGCIGTATLTFSSLAGAGVETFALKQNVGSDNGFYRQRDGFCGTWEKSANASGNSPGTKNSDLPPINTSEAINVSAFPSAACGVTNSTWSAGITVSDLALLPATYRIYSDNTAPYGQLNPGDIQITQGEVPTTVQQTLTNINSVKGRDMFVQVITNSGCIQITKQFNDGCSALPVSLKSFNAQRNKATISLKWETVSEENNRGFYVQRNTKGIWENIAYVFSAADGGNSTELLSYSYNDVNNEKGVSQYRIKQVDLDNKATYSVIRSVKGEGQISKTVVYPNPATEGKVNVVFEDQSAKAVTVSDVSGRVLRQYRNVVNSLVVDGLESGMYTIQITDLSSAVSTAEKVIIKKR